MADPNLRHPEKAHKPDSPIQRKPSWIRVKAPTSRAYQESKKVVRDAGLHTVCEEAACPNIGECWAAKHVTVMIMGDTCTRACAFCNVKTGKPGALDPMEPYNLAMATKDLGLKHVVITSVDRDDLEDGGAAHFAECITKIREATPETTIEVLTPDFLNKHGALPKVVTARPDVYNHNLETVPRLYHSIRPEVKRQDPSIFTKSGLMVGLGETQDEVTQVMDDLRSAGVDFLTIGQYLQPTRKHAPIDRFVTPDEFQDYAQIARGKGFLMVSASPLTRSSYHADSDFAEMRAAREAKLAAASA